MARVAAARLECGYDEGGWSCALTLGPHLRARSGACDSATTSRSQAPDFQTKILLNSG